MGKIKLIPAICPHCGANLKVPGDSKVAPCKYCGVDVLISEKNEIHYHIEESQKDSKNDDEKKTTDIDKKNYKGVKKDKSTLGRTIWGIAKDLLIAAAIVGIFMGILYAYSGVWPPPVVVESQSMSHDPPGSPQYLPPSQIGVIDGGDMVIVKKVTSISDITTYIQGKKSGYQTYGGFGDVLIYKPPTSVRYDTTPVIHRAVIWVEFNKTTGNSWDVPELGRYNTNAPIQITDYGYDKVTITISLSNLLQNFRDEGTQPHGGFITMGDHNAPYYDQVAGICPEPVQFDWIMGVARGELPWFGALKLWLGGNTAGVPENSWWYLFTSIALIIIVPIVLDYAIDRIKKHRRARKSLLKNPPKHTNKGEPCVDKKLDAGGSGDSKPPG